MTAAEVVRRRRPVVITGLIVASVSLLSVPAASALGIDASDDAVTRLRIAADIVFSAGAAIALALVARRRHGTDRAVWGLLAAGCGAWCLGSVLWASYLARGAELPVPSPADAAYLVLPLAWTAAGVVGGARRQRDRPGRPRAIDLIDSAIVGLSLLVILWVVAFHAGSIDAGDTATLVTMIYPIGAAVAATLLTRSLAGDTADRRAFTLVVAGVTAYTIGDIGFLVATRTWAISDAVPTLVDTGWIVGFTLLAGAAWVAWPGPEAPLPRTRRTRSGLLAVGLASAAAVVALVDLTQDDGTTWTTSTLVAVMILLLTRQSLTLAENRRLSRDLVDRIGALAHRADHDELTALANRSHLKERLQAVIHRSDPATPGAVMFLDIDMLKPVNDSLGHDRGDELIRTVAGRLRDRFGDDVVRFGGDEFVVILRGRPSIEAILADAEEMARDMRRPYRSGGITLAPSTSVGVAVVEADATPDELLRRADTALYHAKDTGRGRAALYDPSMDAVSARRLRIAPELRRAVDDGELELHYQPIVHLSTGRIQRVEALLRWRHPEKGILTPDRFLTEADALGLLPEIGRRSLLEGTCRIAEVNRRNPDRAVQIAVNLSASELGTDVLLGVDEALAASGLEPAMLVLEITEDVIVDESVRRTLAELRSRGVTIAIDDFGTGNSSLRQLGDYPASVLKIDRSFVDGIDGADDRLIVRAVVDLAAELDLITIGEGVETAEQAELLAAMGCVHGQGWLFDRAVPFETLERRWLQGPPSTARALRALGRTRSSTADGEAGLDPTGSTDPTERTASARSPSIRSTVPETVRTAD
ncbi:MAG: bifunctional diguanylate cyclase/phosphodiesterase [Microthrixaceae bacterium]|nr:bifunctional diguanylate cyclase/phosphodiesterase [Microthrixaceae bacterium]